MVLLFSGFYMDTPAEEPLFFTMSDEWKQVKHIEPVAEFIGVDTLMTQSLQVMLDQDRWPLLFYSEVQTSVCADGECKLADLNIYWNLLGHYVGFSPSKGLPLTKFEHEEFTSADYLKLHQLLSDKNSVLRRKKMHELVDKVPVKPKETGKHNVDGVSAATKKEIKEAVVEGGLYSCYTFWHLVYGQSVQQLVSGYIEQLPSDSLNRQLLYSPYQDYRYAAIQRMSEEQLLLHKGRLVAVFAELTPMMRTYLLKKMRTTLLSDTTETVALYTNFTRWDTNTRTRLLRSLQWAHPQAVDLLSGQVKSMTRNQLKIFTDHITQHPDTFTTRVKQAFEEAEKDQHFVHRDQLTTFLEQPPE